MWKVIIGFCGLRFSHLDIIYFRNMSHDLTHQNNHFFFFSFVQWNYAHVYSTCSPTTSKSKHKKLSISLNLRKRERERWKNHYPQENIAKYQIIINIPVSGSLSFVFLLFVHSLRLLTCVNWESTLRQSDKASGVSVKIKSWMTN